MSKRFTKRSAAMSLAAIAALALAACGGNGGNGGTEGTTPAGGTTAGGSTEGGEAPAPSGESVVLNLATMVQTTTPHHPVTMWFFDELAARSDGRLTVDVTNPEEVCPGPEIAQCVRDGRADIGVTITDYTPALFPTQTVVSLPFMADNASAVMQALYEMYMENEDAQAVWEGNDLEFVGAWPVGRLIMGSHEELDNMGDLEGFKLRAIGPYTQQSFQLAGSNIVSIAAAETYEGIQNRLADGVAWTFDGPVDYGLMELLPYWTDPGFGHYTVFSMWVNDDVYEGLPDDLKAIFDEVREDFNTGEGIVKFNESSGRQCDELLGNPTTEKFDRWEESDTQEWKDLVGTQMIDQWVEQATTDGLANAEQYLADYQDKLATFADAPDLVEDPVIACVDRYLTDKG
ncbi:MAG: TRAP transporter substrate-binding protein DctP [bacterium]|nr:TRAP transporter substrate-binding protein DctP [bacterium]